MPKEDMHLWGAQEVFKSIKSREIKKIVEKNIDYFYLGSLIPDSFIYVGKSNISGIIHGDTKKNCDYFIKKLLKSKNEKNRAFVYGYITHCAFDGTWHPVINYFAGNYKKIPFKIYNHFLYETYLATLYGVERPWTYLNSEVFKKTNFNQLGFSLGKFTLNVQKVCIYLMKKRWSYELFYILSKLRLFPKKAISLFEHHLLRDNRCFRNGQKYKDLITGMPNKVDFDSLNKKAVDLAISMINSAHKTGTCKGFNLATGKKNKTIFDARYIK